MPQPILTGLKEDHVRRVLADLDDGICPPFGVPTLLNKERKLKPTEQEADTFRMTRTSIKDGLNVVECLGSIPAISKGLTGVGLRTGNPSYLTYKVADVDMSADVGLVGWRNTLPVIKCTIFKSTKSERIAAFGCDGFRPAEEENQIWQANDCRFNLKGGAGERLFACFKDGV